MKTMTEKIIEEKPNNNTVTEIANKIMEKYPDDQKDFDKTQSHIRTTLKNNEGKIFKINRKTKPHTISLIKNKKTLIHIVDVKEHKDNEVGPTINDLVKMLGKYAKNEMDKDKKITTLGNVNRELVDQVKTLEGHIKCQADRMDDMACKNMSLSDALEDSNKKIDEITKICAQKANVTTKQKPINDLVGKIECNFKGTYDALCMHIKITEHITHANTRIVNDRLVKTLRHVHTNYDKLNKNLPYRDHKIVKNAVLGKISEKYPELTNACENQMA